MLVLVLYGHTLRRLSTITQTKKMHVQTHPVCSSETQANPLPAQQKTEKFNSHFLSKCYSPGSHIWDHRLFQDEHRQDMEIMPIVIFFLLLFQKNASRQIWKAEQCVSLFWQLNEGRREAWPVLTLPASQRDHSSWAHAEPLITAANSQPNAAAPDTAEQGVTQQTKKRFFVVLCDLEES